MTNKFALPYLGFGMGLRHQHYDYIFSNLPKIGWFEVISENFMDTGGKPQRMLAKIRESYPVVMHGVSLSIGTIDPLNSEYLKKLKDLAIWAKPAWISDHLCWTGVAHKNTHDLLPVPYTEEALKHIIQRIKEVQDFLERPILMENPSTYLEFRDSQMPEWEFICRMAEEADCGLLLDINNIYVTCYNHRLDPKQYIDAISENRVVQIHLAGHENKGEYIIDTHEGHVIDEVWALYKYAMSKLGEVSTMIEWDANIPDFPVVMAEVEKAKTMAKSGVRLNELPDLAEDYNRNIITKPIAYNRHLWWLQDAILAGDNGKSAANDWVVDKPRLLPKDQLYIYIDAYRARLHEVLSDDLPALRKYLGGKLLDKLLYEYIENTPSSNFNISRYIIGLPQFIKQKNKVMKNGGRKEISYEIALLEMELSRIFDLGESKSLNSQKFSSINPEDLLRLKFRPRTALKLLEFDYNVNSYYNNIMAGKKAPSIKKNKNFLAVYRHEDKLWRLELEKEEYQLLKILFAGNTLEEALEKINGEDEEVVSANLQSWFSKWLGNNIMAE